jgi:glutathione S-transferase
MQVHMFSGSAFAWRVLLALELKGLDYTEVPVQAAQAALKSPEFLALNPRGKVPVICDGDYTLAESAAIMAYLDRKAPEPPLFGRTAAEAGAIWRALLDFDLYVCRDWVERIVVPIFTGRAAAEAEAIRRAARASHAELAKLEGAVGRLGSIATPALSAADLAVFPVIETLLRAAGKPDAQPLGLDLLPFAPRYPALAAWRARIQALPAYARTYPAHWKKLDAAA